MVDLYYKSLIVNYLQIKNSNMRYLILFFKE
jgi:hypothetical protein